MTTVWQIAAGDPERDYSAVFIAHDVMFMGPGNPGPFALESYQPYVESGTVSAAMCHAISKFQLELQTGDLVLLRQGYHVLSIGLIDGGTYLWDSRFDDVFGWDLQHCRRIVWQDHLCEELEQIQNKRALFDGRKQIPTFTRVNDRAILDRVEHLFQQCQTRELRPLPPALPEPLSLDALGEELFARGVANDAVDHVVRALQRQRRLLKWYHVHGVPSERPDEHEVVAHMVPPLLLALGWSEQLLAVEWHKVDLAAFWTTPTTNNNCVLVCEAKQIRHGMGRTRQQAFQYVQRLALTHCQKVLVTQGGRFYLYEHDGSGWRDRPSGYFNVERIRTQHLMPADTNAVDTLVALAPAGVQRPVAQRVIVREAPDPEE